MNYKKIWYRLRKNLTEISKQGQQMTIEQRRWEYEDIIVNEILFQMLEMEEELALAEEKLLEE